MLSAKLRRVLPLQNRNLPRQRSCVGQEATRQEWVGAGCARKARMSSGVMAFKLPGSAPKRKRMKRFRKA